MGASASRLAGARKDESHRFWRHRSAPLLVGIILIAFGAAGCATTSPVYVDGPERLSLPAVPEPGYEPYPTFAVEEILPERWLEGPHHEFVDPVVNDGFANHFLIHSDFGEFEAVGLIEAEKRFREIQAIVALQEMSGLKEGREGFEEAAKDTVKAPFRTLKRIVKNPLYLVLVIPSELGAAVSIANDAGRLVASGFSKDAVKDLIGYTDAKAELANSLGVDPESPNPALQSRLNSAAWNYYTGKLPVRVAEEFIPGLPMIHVSVVSGGGSLAEGVEFLSESIGEKSEYERLRRMGLDHKERKNFRRMTPLTSSEREQLVHHLYMLEEANGRTDVLKLAASADTQERAWRIVRQAQMLAEYDRTIEPIEAIQAVDSLLVARAQGGLAIVPMSFDYVAWTPESERLMREAERTGRNILNARAVEFWLLGQGTERFFSECRQRGHLIHGNAIEVLVAEDAGQRVTVARKDQQPVGAVLVPHGYGAQEPIAVAARDLREVTVPAPVQAD